jgi:hypothetical protein
MSEQKHTSGPWVADCDIYPVMVYSKSQRRPTHDEGGNMNGEVMEFIANTGESKANARLIAAAPDLLEALSGFVEHGTCFDEIDMAKALAAIAKATGIYERTETHTGAVDSRSYRCRRGLRMARRYD